MTTFTTAATSRRLHVLDVENLMGGTEFTVDAVAALRSRYKAITNAQADPMVLGASADSVALAAGFGWPGPRLVVRHGHDGADLALLEVLTDEVQARRFSAVVVGSGDGIFSEVAAELAGRGVTVTVVSCARSLSRRLRMAASRVIILDGPSEAPTTREAA